MNNKIKSQIVPFFRADVNEEKKKGEWRVAAKKELEEWYRHHEDLITKTKATNR